MAVLGTVYFHWLPAHGWSTATEWIAWFTLGCYAVSFLAAFLLPLKPRQDALPV